MSTTGWLQLGFLLLSGATILLVAAAIFLAGARRSAALYLAGGVAWACFTCGLAAAGVLNDFSLPPRIILVFLLGAGLVALASFSSAGEALIRLPIAVLVGLQSFRIAVELLIHAAVVHGVAPPQMTWTGLNFDILAGAGSPLVAFALHMRWAGRRTAFVWNVVGLLLLLWIVVVGVLSMPTPLQVLHPQNTWVVHAPYVLLPAVLVWSAVLLHVAAIRKLLRGRGPHGA